MNMTSNLNWHDIPWKLFHEEVSKIQEEIVMAYKNKNLRLVYQLQRKLVTSLSGRALATRRVITNSGGSTPGIDKQLWDNPSKRMDALLELKEITNNPKGYKASPLKRVWIPKENRNKMRLLGIPTLIDRAVLYIKWEYILWLKSNLTPILMDFGSVDRPEMP
jgi:RNA-directed DNA polymerase